MLSIHRPQAKAYRSNEQFGHYLAGLIDGDGHFDTQGCFVLAFNSRDRQLAEYIRSRLGHGKIYKVQNKSCVVLKIFTSKGLIVLSKLIHNKLKHPSRINQFNTRITTLPKLNDEIKSTSLDTTINFNTAWFAGFVDADGQLVIRSVKRENRARPEIRLHLKIDQKSNILLEQFQNQFGGYLGYRALQDTYYYSSTSFENMRKVLSYFDKFTPQNKYVCLQYVILRKSYLMVQSKEHLTQHGLSSEA